MSKTKDNILSIFGNAVVLYFSNFVSLMKYMAFPVFGQILGIILILVGSYYYTLNISKNMNPSALAENISLIFIMLFIISLPGIIFLVKAFWDYLVAYGSINSMIENMQKSGKIYDFHAHNEVITRRSVSYGALWGILAILGLIGIFPVFWILAGILFVYFILVFQVFAFEPQQSVLGCFKRSLIIIKGNFARTAILAIILGGTTYWLIPKIIIYVLNSWDIIKSISIPLDSWTSLLPINSVNKILEETLHMPYQINSLIVAQFIVAQLITYVLTCLMLPLRVICWGLWYKNLNKGEMKLDKRILDRATNKSSTSTNSSRVGKTSKPKPEDSSDY